MKGINTLINTIFFFFHHLLLHTKKSPVPEQHPAILHVSTACRSLTPQCQAPPSTASFRKREVAGTGRQCSGLATPSEHPRKHEKGIIQPRTPSESSRCQMQSVPKHCYTAFPSSLLSYTKPKNNLRADRRDFEISIGLLSPNCLKLKFICILCRNINKRPQMYLYLYILQEPSKIIHRTKINLL